MLKPQEVLDIQETKIYARYASEITIDERYGDLYSIDAGRYYIVPGLLDIYIVDLDDWTSLPFNFEVKLIKPADIIEEKSSHRLIYKPGDLIIEQDHVEESITDVRPIIRILDGQARYFTKPEHIVMALHELLPQIDLVHLETIAQNMFRCKDDHTVPCRLKGYKDCVLIGMKQLPRIDSWLTGVMFENIRQSIKSALLADKPIQGTTVDWLSLGLYERI